MIIMTFETRNLHIRHVHTSRDITRITIWNFNILKCGEKHLLFRSR